MSVRHSSASHSQTLPSFSVAFSNSSLDRLSAHTNSLPPIQSQSPPDRNAHPSDPSQHLDRPPEESGSSQTNGRKRSHPDTAPYRDDVPDNRHRSPRLVRVKEEHDELADDSPYPPRTSRSQPAPADVPPPPLVAPQAPSKKRRVTISGLDAHPNGNPADAAPMSPVVVGIPSMRDDPGAMEQVRSMLAVRQNQKALIEQRRESLGGPAPSSSQLPTATNGQPPPAAPRSSARSPNMNGNRGRLSDPAIRPPSPSPIIVPSQQPPASASPAHPNALPPPPISFARRRATNSVGGKKKPADILISPRDVRTQPVIQSAPPQQGGRFSMMALPTLPNVQQPATARRVVPGNVPPTPTRLSMRNSIASTPSTALAVPTVAPGSGHSPPIPASVPIASTLIPPTPAMLHRPDYDAPRASFLAPFEMFYDALRDAKELKTWLGEQLTKSQALQASLVQTQERIETAVEAAVERRVGAMRDEMDWLKRRVQELEEARHAQPDAFGAGLARRRSVADGEAARPPTFSPMLPQPPMPAVPDTYTFPPVHPPQDADGRGADADSPAPFDIGRRQSVSAIRMDPPPPPPSSYAPGDAQAVKSPSLGLGARRGSMSSAPRPAPMRRSSAQLVQRPSSRSHSPMDDT